MTECRTRDRKMTRVSVAFGTGESAEKWRASRATIWRS
jgi:hypothetical protein